jgi:hypothetical protein
MKLEVFIAYSHANERMKQKLIKHLSSLRRSGLVEAWHDRQIQPGADWEREIDQHLDRSQIILLLISADFIDSDYCYGIEMKRALEREGRGEARVIPVILRDCDWHPLPLIGRRQGLPQKGKPVTKWSNQDEAYADIARELRKVVEEMGSKASYQAEAAADAAYDVTYRVIAEPVFVPIEGYTERTADLILNLSTESVLASTALPLTVRVYVNTAVTNSLSPDGLSDAVLTSNTGATLADGRVAGNELTFEEVAAPCPRPGQETTLHIKNVVVNANGLVEPCMIHATVVIEGPPSVRIAPTRGSFPIAIPTQALAFWVTVPKDGASPAEVSDHKSAPGSAIAHIHFAERFPGGFRYRSKGPAGTQLMAMFTGLPKGASLWVGARPIRGSNCAKLVAREAATLSPIQATDTFNGVPVVKLPVVERLSDANASVSIAVWEVEAPQSRDVRSYEFPIFLRCEAAMSPNLTQIIAYGSLAPNPLGGGFTSTTGSAAPRELPVPRYSLALVKKRPFFRSAPRAGSGKTPRPLREFDIAGQSGSAAFLRKAHDPYRISVSAKAPKLEDRSLRK